MREAREEPGPDFLEPNALREGPGARAHLQGEELQGGAQPVADTLAYTLGHRQAPVVGWLLGHNLYMFDGQAEFQVCDDLVEPVTGGHQGLCLKFSWSWLDLLDGVLVFLWRHSGGADRLDRSRCWSSGGGWIVVQLVWGGGSTREEALPDNRQ